MIEFPFSITYEAVKEGAKSRTKRMNLIIKGAVCFSI